MSASHRLDGFDCGEQILNDWLMRRALANHLGGASRTFVIVNPSDEVVGFYSLAAGAVAHALATGQVRRNMPDPVPAMVLGRLAIDRRAQGNKLGVALLQDAVLRVRGVAEHAGVRAILVHALNERARAFYLNYGFQVSPIDPMVLLLRL